jgi:hypothetical protein
LVSGQQLVNTTNQIDVSTLAGGMYYFRYYNTDKGYNGAGKLVIKN